jgi:uncharacterized repeat protein (TIGR01451 family)
MQSPTAAEPAVEENVTEMSIMSIASQPRSRRARRAGRTAAVLAGALLALLLLAASALADVQWTIDSVHGPEHVPPGGRGQYVLQAFNTGIDPTTDTYTITDTLPAGVTAVDLASSDPAWSCNSLPATTVVCSDSDEVSGAGENNIRRRGATPKLIVTVTVDPGVSGVRDNSATISGGDPSAADASTTDPTTFSATQLGFGFAPGSFKADVFDAQRPGGSPVRQAGSHPFEARVDFRSNLQLTEDPDDVTVGDLFYTEPAGHVKTLETKLPAGLIGNPQATPQCDPILLAEPGANSKGFCPTDTQVGVIDLRLNEGKVIDNADPTTTIPVYNVAPPPGVVAAFAFSLVGIPVLIKASLDPTDHYAVIARIENTVEVNPVRSAQLTLWGVPADPAHDALREDPHSGLLGNPFTDPIKPFLTMPAQCGVDGMVQMRADSWDAAGAFTPWQQGTTAQMTGCDDSRFHFDPTITVQPESLTPSTPTGLNVDLAVPQKDDTVDDASKLYAGSADEAAIATPPLRNAVVTLPAGMTVSPSSADGLVACTPLQIGLGTNDEPTCPDGAKIGTISIDTPLLPDPLTGSIYLAAQNDNPFGSTLAIYLVAKGPGVIVKLPGEVAPDATTGQLTTTFDDNPQLPFSHLHLHFNSGDRAPLVTPPTCGTQTTTAQLTSWNGSLPAVQTTASFTISADGHGAPCGARGFDPSFAAGTTNPVAGKDSPLVTKFGRSDQDQELGKVDVSFPQGLLGRIAAAVLCSDADANAGTCGEGSRIGSVTVGAGPGPHPFYITDGRVYITEPYNGAPYGLSIVVHAKAGPLDLGNVVVRAKVLVDRRTAALRIVSEPLPTILDGIPLQVRLVDVTVDRPGFTFNPTNCSVMSARAQITSTGGTVASKSSRFQAGGCGALPFAPRMSISVGSKGHTQNRLSTPLTATVTMGKGQANLRSVSVTLPLTLNARLGVVNQACTLVAFDAGHCTRKARVGSAVAVTPLLRDPLRGSVYFVKNPARVIPDLMVALRGPVDVDLTGKVRIPGGKALSTRFDTVPDVPITKFSLRLVSGTNGPVGTAANLCTAKSRAALVQLGFRAQSGKVVRRSQRLHVNGCPARH